MAERLKVFLIDISAEAIPASRGLLAVPSRNPSLGFTLEVTGFEEQGFMIRLTDPAGGLIWAVMLNAKGGVNGPTFGADITSDTWKEYET